MLPDVVTLCDNPVTLCDITPLLLSKSKIKKERGEKITNKIKEKERKKIKSKGKIK